MPSATVCLSGFMVQGAKTAKGQGAEGLPLAEYPGHTQLHSDDDIRRNVREMSSNNVVRALTSPVTSGKSAAEPGPTDIVFTGDLEAVNDFFHQRRWTDGLPIVPPSIKRIQRFLEFTDRSADEVIGVLLPSQRTATVWSVAVNGVMAGCRPEYMPILLAIVEVMADPTFGLKHLGHTPGAESLITINGPIVKQLGFNYQTGALRVGFQANTSIGRFLRLYMINGAGFVVGQTDKGTFGGSFRVVLAENDDAVKKMGWQPTTVEAGFDEQDSIITIRSVTAMSVAFASNGDSAEQHLARIADRTTVSQEGLPVTLTYYGGSFPQIILSPCVAEVIANGGYSKSDVKQYFYDHVRLPAWKLEGLIQDEMKWTKESTLCYFVREGVMPPLFCESTDPNRMVPMVCSPDDYTITVSGDPGRNRVIACVQNGDFGFPTTRRIVLPAQWEQLLAEVKSGG